MANKFIVNGPKYPVACSESSWNHIIEGHGIMKENEQALKDAIVEPAVIYGSAEWPRRHVYYGKSDNATYGSKLYTKVVVDAPDEYNGTGNLVSAWPQKDINGNIDEGRLLYVKAKLGS